MVSPGTRATPRRSTGRRSGAWGQAPSIGRRGRPFEASRQTRARARRGESGGRADEASRVRGGWRRLHSPAGRDRPHLPARRGAGDRRGQDENDRSLPDAGGGGGAAQTQGARGGSGRVQAAGGVGAAAPIFGRGPRGATGPRDREPSYRRSAPRSA